MFGDSKSNEVTKLKQVQRFKERIPNVDSRQRPPTW